jgi:hypothetical protein
LISSFLKRYAPLISILKWAGLVALVVFLVLLWRNGRNQDAAIKKAKNDSAAADKKIAGKEQEIKQIQADRDAKNAALEAEKKKPATVKTVQTYVKIPGQFILVQQPGQPEHIEITGDVQQNLDALQDDGIDAQECKNSLLACNASLDKKQKEFDVMQHDRDEWKNTANGGTKWAKTKKELKCAAIGGAAAAGGAFYKRGFGAFLGAAGGELLCHILSK